MQRVEPGLDKQRVVAHGLVHQALQLIRHLVQALREHAHFISAPHVEVRAEFAAADGLHGAADPAHGARQQMGQHDG